MILAWLLSALALGAPAAEELRAWSDTAVELRPDAYGDGGMRAVERFGVAAGLGDGWEVLADAGLRLRQHPYGDARLDLYRLDLRRVTDRYTLRAGRHVRLDPRGFQRLDGVSVRTAEAGVQVEGWAGRLWHPMTWTPGDTVVFGGQAVLRPLVDGRPSRLVRYTAGWEGRISDVALAHRAHLAASARNPRGHRADALLEVEPGSGARGRLGGGLPAGRTVDVGAELRYEGLRHATSPYGTATPIDWLTRGGYGVGTVRAGWRSGGWHLAAHGGPSVRHDGTVGGLGRIGLGWGADAVSGHLFAVGAGLDGAWLGGGGGGLGYATAAVRLDGDLGVYRHRGLDGGTAPIWEGRLQGRVPVNDAVAVALQGAAGTDRQLAAWVRGGVALQARLERSR